MACSTVVLATEHLAYREGLAQALSAQAGLELVAVCADAESALREIVARRPAVCLVDVALRPWGGLELCRRARDAVPDTPPSLVLMSSDPAGSLDREARSAGAVTVVDKDLSRTELCTVLLEIATASPEKVRLDLRL